MDFELLGSVKLLGTETVTPGSCSRQLTCTTRECKWFNTAVSFSYNKKYKVSIFPRKLEIPRAKLTK